jgi:hypothetical protein
VPGEIPDVEQDDERHDRGPGHRQLIREAHGWGEYAGHAAVHQDPGR